MAGVEYQVTKVDPTDPETKGMVYQVHKVSEEVAATLGGKVYRARIIKDPTEPTVVGKVYQIVLIDDPDDPSVKGKVYNAILTGGSEAVIVGPAVSPLALDDAVADTLTYIKAYGGTKQNGTPTPDAPMDIVCNNGVLKLNTSATGYSTQTGTPTPTNPIDIVNYKQGDLILRGIGDYKDTYDATTGTITRNVGVVVLDGTESWNYYSVAQGTLFRTQIADSVSNSKDSLGVLCNAYQVVGVASRTSGTLSGATTNYDFINDNYTTVDDWKAYLAAQYAAGVPVIIYYPLETPTTEHYVGVYADGLVETINVHGKNLFTTDNATLDWAIPQSGIPNQSIGSAYTKLLPAQESTTYYLSGTNTATDTRVFRLHAYDKNGNWIAQVSSKVTSSGETFGISGTTPAGTKYLRLSYSQFNLNTQLERGSTATEYEPYYDGGTATAEMLLKVGDYQDVQEIIDGTVTRKVGVKVLAGSESWTATAIDSCYTYNEQTMIQDGTVPCYSTHFQGGYTTLPSKSDRLGKVLGYNGRIGLGYDDRQGGVENFKQWLSDQYAAGTPVIVLYPLATPTTETVTGQPMQVQQGDNIVEITQASLSGLQLEAEYEKEAD